MEPVAFSFIVPGRLGSWQRAGRNTTTGVTFTPKEMRSEQAMIKQLAWEVMRRKGIKPLTGAVKMVVQTWRQPPKSWSLRKQAAAKWIAVRPDFDNTLKLIADALNRVAYEDDAQIAVGAHFKRYHITRPEAVHIEITELL